MGKWGYRLVALIQRLAASPGEHRNVIGPVLSGKPSELPAGDPVYELEAEWVRAHDPQIVHFGEYQLAVVRVPSELDPGEVGRRARLHTGARLSLSARAGDDLVVLSCNDEKRPLNVVGLAELVSSRVSWAHAKQGGDRIGRLQIDDLGVHPERMEAVIGEIVRNRSVLYG